MTFRTIRVGQLDADVTLHVENAPTGAKLDAWIDFNGDGVWGGAFEQIAGAVRVAEGDHTITFVVPEWAVAGTTYARFRLSTAGGLEPAGVADDGEVEDHSVAIRRSGDMNFDGQVDFDDIDVFALGLTDPAAYEAVFGRPGSWHGDADLDGDLDFDDIEALVELLVESVVTDRRVRSVREWNAGGIRLRPPAENEYTLWLQTEVCTTGFPRESFPG